MTLHGFQFCLHTAIRIAFLYRNCSKGEEIDIRALVGPM